MLKNRIAIVALAACLLLLAMACTQPPPPTPTPTAPPAPEVDVAALKAEVVANYAAGAHTLYANSLASARIMDEAINAFLGRPHAGCPGSGQAGLAVGPGGLRPHRGVPFLWRPH